MMVLKQLHIGYLHHVCITYMYFGAAKTSGPQAFATVSPCQSLTLTGIKVYQGSKKLQCQIIMTCHPVIQKHRVMHRFPTPNLLLHTASQLTKEKEKPLWFLYAPKKKKFGCIKTFIHSSSVPLILLWVTGELVPISIRVHPGQVANSSQGNTETYRTNTLIHT
ncbi:hypothetical protein AMECASPLE_034241 [Ameca splendens]|uniref:Uncharacterized protein n=1 Tax=Ameca splendens TaxID=208324 RepID=A0ABV0YVC4_9TELE